MNGSNYVELFRLNGLINTRDISPPLPMGQLVLYFLKGIAIHGEKKDIFRCHFLNSILPSSGFLLLQKSL